MADPPNIRDRTNQLQNRRWRCFAASAQRWAFVLALAVTGMASISVARADEAQAKSLLKGMSDYLAAQKAISFDY